MSQPLAVPAAPDVTSDLAPDLRLAERRRSGRVSQMVPGWISGPAGRHTSGREVTIRDLSLHGVGLLTDRPCDVGDRRWVLVNRGAMRLSTRMQVASCRRRDDGLYEVGGEFY